MLDCEYPMPPARDSLSALPAAPRYQSDATSEILLWVIRGGIIAILFLPLVFGSKFFFPFIVLKNVLFRMITEILAVVYAALALRDARYRPRWHPLTGAVLAFFGIATLTAFTGIAPRFSLWGNYERMGGLLTLWHLALYFFILVNVVRRWDDWSLLLTASVLVSLLMSLFAFGQWLNIPFLLKSSGGARLTATIGNATYLAAYLLFHLFLLGYFFFRDREFRVSLIWWGLVGLDALLIGYDVLLRLGPAETSLLSQLLANWRMSAVLVALHGAVAAAWWWRSNRIVVRAFLAGLFALNFFIFFQTQTRGALVGLLVGVFLLAATVAVLRWKTAAGKVGLAVIAACVAAPMVLYATHQSSWVEKNPLLARLASMVKKNPTLERLSSISFQDVTTQSRLDTWRTSWRGWTEDPVRFIIGYGLENYSQVFNRHFPPRVFKDPGSQIWFDRAHNVIFDVGVTTGLIGLVAYLGIFLVAGFALGKSYRQSGDLVSLVVPLAAVVAYFIQNLFVFDTLDSSLLFYLIIAAVVVKSSPAFSGNKDQPKPPPVAAYTPNQVGVLIAIGGVAIFSLYALNLRTLGANHAIYQVLLTFPPPPLDEQRKLFRRAIDGSPIGRTEARQQYANFALGLTRNEKVKPDEIRPLVQEAMVDLKKSVAEGPTDVRNHLYFASVANRANLLIPDSWRPAIDVLEPAIDLSPTRPQLYFELGQSYLLKGDVARGLELYEQGLRLSSHVLESHIDTAVVYILARRPEEAFTRLTRAKTAVNRSTIPADQYQRLIRAADRTNQVEVVVKLYELLVADFPSSADYYAKLAGAYAKAGDRAKAEAAARKSLELDPSIQDEFDDFLKQLREQ